jgi:CheY-like chemotaxis protein
MFLEKTQVSKPFILCVDDEELGLQIRRAVLERAGYSVLTALNGREGLDAFSSDPVDLVILDYSMPGMHGGDVALEMRRLRPQVPIILLSAYVNLPTEVTRIVDCSILKGDGPELLLAKVREFLSGRAGGINHGEDTE